MTTTSDARKRLAETKEHAMTEKQIIENPTYADTEREALLADIRSVTDLWDEPLDEVHDLPPLVDALLAAGWHRDPSPHRDVRGRCPSCGRESLFLGDGGYVTCRRMECSEPDAATTLLERDPSPAAEALIARLRSEGHGPKGAHYDDEPRCSGCVTLNELTAQPVDVERIVREAKAEQREELAKAIEDSIADEPTLMHVTDWVDATEHAARIVREGVQASGGW